jgi:hypothetical protein
MTSRPSSHASAAAPAPIAPEGGRRSHALESVTSFLHSNEGLQILDWGGINQCNLDFVTGLGHRLYSEDLLRTAEAFFTREEMASGTVEPARIEEFLEVTLSFADQSSDCALLWDCLQFLPPCAASAFVERLFRVLAPDSLVLAFFHHEPGQTGIPHACRILDTRHLKLSPRTAPRPIHAYNTRAIEKFFHRYQSVKFFLTRDNTQEVVVRR